MVVAGAGPVGLTAAIDLALRGIDVLLVDEDDTVSVGSRAICWSKRTLEILDRLGCAERLVQKGVGWSVGRVFFRDEQVYEFNLLPGDGHRRPAFINLQQYWVEQFLVERLFELAPAELRWRSKVVGVEQRSRPHRASHRRPRWRIHGACRLADRRRRREAARFATCSDSNAKARSSTIAF